MATQLSVNSFRAYLASSLQQSGSETTIYIDRITTLTGETIQTSDFSTFGRGTITIDPLSTTSIEFASFTGVDAVNIALTGAIRGLSAKGSTSSTSRMPYHAVSTPVIISFGVHNLEDLTNYIQGLIAGGVANATDVASGITFLTENLSARGRAYSALVTQQASPNMTLKVIPFAMQDINFAGGNSPTFTAPSVNPRIDLLVYNYNSATILIRPGTESATPTEPPPLNGDMILCSVYHRHGETTLLDRDIAPNTQGYIKRWYRTSYPYSTVFQTGDYKGLLVKTVPTGWFKMDGTAYSRSTYSALFAFLNASQTVTITLASPGVFTTPLAHNFQVGDQIALSTTGGLPTGLLNSIYYYISAIPSSTTFRVSQTPTETISAITMTIASPAVVTTPYNHLLTANAPFQFTTDGALPTGVSTGTTYYVLSSGLTATTFQFASTAGGTAIVSSGSQNGQHTLVTYPVDVNTSGSQTGTHTVYFTPYGFGDFSSTFNVPDFRGYGIFGQNVNDANFDLLNQPTQYIGEKAHTLSVNQLASHVHNYTPTRYNAGSGGGNVQYTNANTQQDNSAYTGGNASHNNLSPYKTVIWIIKN